ncbi:uncharacterized protein LOC122809642 [Protopterus annectens]|uniref:uncharacterized protein LOC122809642 n=1 Tax=Protopterus annectens TaxID=7888 RepID=UPI001CF9387E|nr:uncharacterized protein LOC122809642 [Protopterus annectens]
MKLINISSKMTRSQIFAFLRKLLYFLQIVMLCLMDAVLSILNVSQIPECINAREGSNISFECQVSGLSKPSKSFYKWYNRPPNGIEYEIKKKMSLQDLETGILPFSILNATLNDSGTYICEVGDISVKEKAMGINVYVYGKHDIIPAEKKNCTDFGSSSSQIGFAVVYIAIGAACGSALVILFTAIIVFKRHRDTINQEPTYENTVRGEKNSDEKCRHQELAPAKNVNNNTTATFMKIKNDRYVGTSK